MGWALVCSAARCGGRELSCVDPQQLGGAMSNLCGRCSGRGWDDDGPPERRGHASRGSGEEDYRRNERRGCAIRGSGEGECRPNERRGYASRGSGFAMPLSGSGSVVDVDNDVEMEVEAFSSLVERRLDGCVSKAQNLRVQIKDAFEEWESEVQRQGGQLLDRLRGRGQSFQEMTRRVESAMAGGEEALRGPRRGGGKGGRGGSGGRFFGGKDVDHNPFEYRSRSRGPGGAGSSGGDGRAGGDGDIKVVERCDEDTWTDGPILRAGQKWFPDRGPMDCITPFPDGRGDLQGLDLWDYLSGGFKTGVTAGQFVAGVRGDTALDTKQGGSMKEGGD
eukprot:10511585-Karenia_brevis.AAC.1